MRLRLRLGPEPYHEGDIHQMKKLIHTLLLLMLVPILMGAQVYDGSQEARHAGELTFDMSSVTNSAAKNLEDIYIHFACEVTSRVGDDDILVTLQGSILTTGSAFANIGTNKTISNATTTASNPSSLQFQDSGTAAQRIRLHVVSGAGLANTIEGTCRPVR